MRVRGTGDAVEVGGGEIDGFLGNAPMGCLGTVLNVGVVLGGVVVGGNAVVCIERGRVLGTEGGKVEVELPPLVKSPLAGR